MARFRSKGLIRGADLVSGATPPAGATLSQMWYNPATGVTYQYTTDGTSDFWLDISSGGIGASTSATVDYVGDTDPHPATNGTGLAVGKIYYNRESDQYFVCKDATGGSNVWEGRYIGTGGVETFYTSGTTHYRVHAFYGDGTFYLDIAKPLDILWVGGGGGGGGEFGGGGGGGGVLYVSGRTMPAGVYPIVVGHGGRMGIHSGKSNYQALIGGTTTAFGGTVYGGGPGMSRSTAWSDYTRTNMANGGGAGQATLAGEAGTATSSSGVSGTGGSFTTTSGHTGGGAQVSGNNYPAGGGAGSGGNGQTPPSDAAGTPAGSGGNGTQVGAILDGTTNHYWAGGGGGGCFNGGGAGGAGTHGGGGGASYSNGAGGNGGVDALTPGFGGQLGGDLHGGNANGNTGAGGGGGTHQYGMGGRGASGIVIVRYALN